MELPLALTLPVLLPLALAFPLPLAAAANEPNLTAFALTDMVAGESESMVISGLLALVVGVGGLGVAARVGAGALAVELLAALVALGSLTTGLVLLLLLLVLAVEFPA